MGSNPHLRNTKLGLYRVPHASGPIILRICAWKSNAAKFQVQARTNKLLFSDQLSSLCAYSSRFCPQSVKSSYSALLSKRSTTELVVICSSPYYSMQACGTLQPVFIISTTSPYPSTHRSFFAFLSRHVYYHTCLRVCVGAFHCQQFKKDALCHYVVRCWSHCRVAIFTCSLAPLRV